MTDSAEAERLVQLGIELSDVGRSADAEGAYRAAARADPEWSVPWYNLGLLCKCQGRWAESLDFNQRAALLDPEHQANWWNLAIAATALGNWLEARRAWSGCGIQLPPGAGPPDGDYGLTPLRLDADGVGEVVWGRRIDPARARLQSVPLPGSPFRWADLVLHDGAPEGFRLLHGKQLPVFNVLMRLEPSSFKTFVVRLGTTDASAIERLEQVATELGGAAENWGTSTNILCRECSLGVPHAHPEHKGTPAHPHCGIAARDAQHAKQILDHWAQTTPDADLGHWALAPGNPE
ncbi:MAG: tetratricopeptide repeat protein [Longimicrobiales bacterium]